MTDKASVIFPNLSIPRFTYSEMADTRKMDMQS